MNLLKKNDFWVKLVKNVMVVLTGNMGSSIINFMVTLILIHTVGNTQYGIIIIAQQYMNLLDGIINFQSWSGVIKYGSEAIVEKNNDRLSAIFKTGIVIDVATAVLGTIVALIALPVASNIMKWNQQMSNLAFIFSLEIIFHIEGTSVGVLRLYDKFKYTSIQLISSALLKLVVIGAYVLVGGNNIAIIVWLYVITDIVKHLLLVFMAFYVLKHELGIRKVMRLPLKYAEKDFVKFTLWSNIGSTVDIPVKYFDIFIISLISTEIVAVYKTFKQIIQILSMLTNPISMAIMPQFSEMVAQNRANEALAKVRRLRNIICSVGIIPVIVTLIIGRPIFNWMLGPTYGDNILLFLLMLILNIYLMAHVGIHPLFNSMGYAKETFLITLTTNILYIIVAYLIVPILDIYGLIVANSIQGILCIIAKMIITKNASNEESKFKNYLSK